MPPISPPVNNPQPPPEEAKPGIHVDPQMYSKLSNQYLKAKDWKGCSAIAVLLWWWLNDKVTEAYEEEGVNIGTVMFGNPVDFDIIANADNLGTTWKSIQRNMQTLTNKGFIRRKRHGVAKGYSFEVIWCAREVSGVKPKVKYTRVPAGTPASACPHCPARIAGESPEHLARHIKTKHPELWAEACRPNELAEAEVEFLNESPEPDEGYSDYELAMADEDMA